MINLAIWNDVASEAFPSRIRLGTHSIFQMLQVKGAAIDASD